MPTRRRDDCAAGIAAAWLALLASFAARADEDFREVFKDPEDGRFDTSRWLVGRKGFLPVPLVITEPAVGYGGGLALAFFHRPPGAAPDAAQIGEQVAPPSISVVMAAGTENGTKIAGAGHLGIWRRDRFSDETFAPNSCRSSFSFCGHYPTAAVFGRRDPFPRRGVHRRALSYRSVYRLR